MEGEIPIGSNRDLPDLRRSARCDLGAEELSELLRDVALVLAAPTPLEVAPLRAALRGAEPLAVAGKPWWLGHLAPRGAGAAAPVLVALTGYEKANVAHALTCVLQAARPRAVILSGVGGGFAQAGVDVGDMVVVEREAYADTGAWSAEGDWLSTEELGLPLAEIAGRPLWNEFPLDPALARRTQDLLQELAWETGEAPGRPQSRPGARAEAGFGADEAREAAGARSRETRETVHRGLGVTSSTACGTAAGAERLWRRWQPLVESMEGAAAAHICLLYGMPLVELRGISNLVGPRDRSSWQVEAAAERSGKAAVAVAIHLLGGEPSP